VESSQPPESTEVQGRQRAQARRGKCETGKDSRPRKKASSSPTRVTGKLKTVKCDSELDEEQGARGFT